MKDRIRVGFKFYPRGYQPKHVLMNKLVSATGYIDLPAGASNVRNDGYFMLPKPAKLMCGEAIISMTQSRTRFIR